MKIPTLIARPYLGGHVMNLNTVALIAVAALVCAIIAIILAV